MIYDAGMRIEVLIVTDHEQEALTAALQEFPTFLAPEEVAELLRVDKSAVYRWIAGGQLHAYKVGQKWRILKVDLTNWLAQQRNDESPPSID